MRFARAHTAAILFGAAACIGFTSIRSAAAPNATPPHAPPGKATVSLVGEGVDVTGEFATLLCGDAYLLGKGMSYQVQAGDWRITVASETRSTGDVPLNTADGDVNVVVTANGPGRQLVRSPRGGGTLKVGDDYMRAEADLELRPILGGQTARLRATFVCGS